mmetsp:Transcript_13458/g.39873  ORF Transcript_13458/g.39873 Transcript_13458/m.39873 type:complete len:389 (+) Transcript_13458:81-1247(+)
MPVSLYPGTRVSFWAVHNGHTRHTHAQKAARTQHRTHRPPGLHGKLKQRRSLHLSASVLRGRLGGAAALARALRALFAALAAPLALAPRHAPLPADERDRLAVRVLRVLLKFGADAAVDGALEEPQHLRVPPAPGLVRRRRPRPQHLRDGEAAQHAREHVVHAPRAPVPKILYKRRAPGLEQWRDGVVHAGMDAALPQVEVRGGLGEAVARGAEDVVDGEALAVLKGGEARLEGRQRLAVVKKGVEGAGDLTEGVGRLEELRLAHGARRTLDDLERQVRAEQQHHLVEVGDAQPRVHVEVGVGLVHALHERKHIARRGAHVAEVPPHALPPARHALQVLQQQLLRISRPVLQQLRHDVLQVYLQLRVGQVALRRSPPKLAARRRHAPA